jgi:hypothetical protein
MVEDVIKSPYHTSVWKRKRSFLPRRQTEAVKNRARKIKLKTPGIIKTVIIKRDALTGKCRKSFCWRRDRTFPGSKDTGPAHKTARWICGPFTIIENPDT